MLKVTLLFKKFTNFTGKIIAREFLGLRMLNFQGIRKNIFACLFSVHNNYVHVLFLYEHKHIGRFSNLD